jgi:hypothetical protein
MHQRQSCTATGSEDENDYHYDDRGGDDGDANVAGSHGAPPKKLEHWPRSKRRSGQRDPTGFR